MLRAMLFGKRFGCRGSFCLERGFAVENRLLEVQLTQAGLGDCSVSDATGQETSRSAEESKKRHDQLVGHGFWF